jgi:mannose-1-phosphate guanylyltransferase
VKAFLLAAGRGTRLQPLTDTTPKCLVTIGGVPLLRIWFELCRAHGVTEVLVNTHHFPAQVEACAAAAPAGLRVATVFEPALLGTAGTVRANRHFVEGEREFFVLYADNLTNVDLSRLLSRHREREAWATLGLYPTDRPHEKGIVACGADGWVRHFEEKPSHPRSPLANAGLFVATPALVDAIPDRAGVDFGTDVFPGLAGRLRGAIVEGYIRDIGSAESYAAAQAEWTGLMPAGAGAAR